MHTGRGTDDPNGDNSPPEPSPGVRERHRAQLRAAITAEAALRAKQPGDTHPRRRRRRGAIVTTSIGAACIAVAIALALTTGGGSGSRNRVVAPAAPPGTPATDKCGSTLPLTVRVPPGYGAAQAGPARESDSPVGKGQLVITYPSATGSIEWRWPADTSALPSGASVPKPTGDVSANTYPATSTAGITKETSLFFLPGQPDGCDVVELTVYDTDASRVATTTQDLTDHPVASR